MQTVPILDEHRRHLSRAADRRLAVVGLSTLSFSSLIALQHVTAVWLVWSISSVWSIWSVWFNQTNETDQINKRDEPLLALVARHSTEPSAFFTRPCRDDHGRRCFSFHSVWQGLFTDVTMAGRLPDR